MSEEYSEQGLVVIGIHTQLKKEGIAEFICANKVPYLIAVDFQGKTAEAYNVFGYPTICIIDQKGVIRSVNPKKERLESLVKSLLQEQTK